MPGISATVRYPLSAKVVTNVCRFCDINDTFAYSSRTSTPDSKLKCASQEEPPNVGDSTYADTTWRPVSEIPDASKSRLLARAFENSGLSNVTAPYDSRKIKRT